MKQRIITITFMVALSITSLFTIGATVQDKTTKQRVMCCCPWCPMLGTPDATKEPGTVNDPQLMMQRCQVMMQTPIFIDSPYAIYGQANILDLSEDQKERLIEIENEARTKALDVLNEEQKKKMGDIPEEPMAMAQMCQQMCSKMMTGGGKTGSMMMCPWMQVLQDSNGIQVTGVEHTVCPVMGGPVNKDIYVEYQGKKVYFCCLMCKGRFEAEPEKYLDKLPQFKQ